jgi:bisphosphoglycerate-dependent phosphoglycerate mutase
VLVKHLDNVSEEAIVKLNIPTAVRKAAAAVANQRQRRG